MKQHTLFEKFREPLAHQPALSQPPRYRGGPPPAKQAATYRAEILAALQTCGEDGVGTARMREICPNSMTQRLSELRRELEKRGLTVEFTPVIGHAGIYRLRPYRTKAEGETVDNEAPARRAEFLTWRGAAAGGPQ